jgi:leucyl-tRNA synthetase
MDKVYAPHGIEEKWQRYWEQNKVFKVSEDPSRKKYYLLEMFPYPSGRIHMGHVRNYTIGDVVARFMMMRGYNVLHPMGWDAFGMPAENAALQSKTHPHDWTYQNIDTMRRQLKRMGFSYDWDRELATCDLIYYKWEQWLFLKMYERDLVYRRKSLVNWCESCQTVLANEQVETGLCWRCKNEVAQKELAQWFFRITRYADELLDSLATLEGWPERVTTMQRNWIGKSYGTEIDFAIENSSEKITVFTTRPDTLYGATFMSLAPENPLALKLAQGTAQQENVRAFIERILKQDKTVRSSEDLEKEGVFTGACCINPVTGFKMPVYVANFVLMEYGTGAVMAVPTHDQRDFEFAKKYGLELTIVIQPEDKILDPKTMDCAFVDDGIMANSQQFNGMKNTAAMEKITEHLVQQGLGRKAVNFRLKDWGISRQRYWGNPIPIIYCDSCGIVPVPENNLPVVLPKDVTITGMGQSPLAGCPEFVNTSCPVCGKPAKRETDTMDTFVESSWYFARYACPEFDQGPLDADRVRYWMPVDQYIGGIEHAVLHLLYARFFTKVLRDLGLVAVDEPFVNLLTQGMVCKETQRCATHGWLYPEDVDNGSCRQCGKPVAVGRTEKMSKSTRNVVDPEQLIQKYGADTARLFCLFASPPEKDLEWSDQGVDGAYRFLARVWRLIAEYREELRNAGSLPETEIADAAVREVRRKTHQTIKKVTEDISERFHFNTAISAVMELVNLLYQFNPREINNQNAWSVFREAVEAVILLLAPMVPHACEELWQELGSSETIIKTGWPAFDPMIAEADEAVIVIQVNGKLRGQITVSAKAPEEEVKKQAFACDKVQPWVEGKEIKKVISVPGKLINIVVK